MADVKLNSLATKTNANAAAIMVKDSATQNQGAEGWITKAQLNQIIRDEIKAQMSAITSGTPDVPVLDGSTLKYMTLANFAKVAGRQFSFIQSNTDLDNIKDVGQHIVSTWSTAQTISNIPTKNAGSLFVFYNMGTSTFTQIYISMIGDNTIGMYIRMYYNSAWISWSSVNMTALT